MRRKYKTSCMANNIILLFIPIKVFLKYNA